MPSKEALGTMADEHKYPMSASVLGRQFGANGQEMNALLAEQGYLAGEPGAYTATEAGTQFAITEDHFQGNAGSLAYSASWETRRWDPSITTQLDISRDDVLRVRADLSERRRNKAAQSSAESDAYWSVVNAGGTAADAMAAADAVAVPAHADGSEAESNAAEDADLSDSSNEELEPEVDERVVVILLGAAAVLLGGLWVTARVKRAWAARKARKQRDDLPSTRAAADATE